MINVDLVKQFADLKKQLVDNGVYGFFNESIQVSASELMDLPNLQIESFESEKFPYRVFVVINGLKLFGLLSKEEMMKFPRPGGYMIDDVNLDGMESGDRIA